MDTQLTPTRMAELVANWLTFIEGMEANFHGQAKAELLAFKNRLIQFLDKVGRMELMGSRSSGREEMLKDISDEFNELFSQATKLGLVSARQFHGAEQ